MSDQPEPAPSPSPDPPPEEKAAPTPVKARWRTATRRQEAGKAGGSGVGLFVLVALLIAVLSALVVWALYREGWVDPEFHPLAVREYTDPRLPVNPLAQQDAEWLSGRFKLATKGFEKQTFDHFSGVLLRLQKPTEAPVVVHLCALARVTPDRKDVLVLPADVDPDALETRSVPLTHVLRTLAAVPAPGKLLLLDVMRPGADPRRGLLSDDVADVVHQVLTHEPLAPGLFVLCACGPGQTSLPAEELGVSGFAYYVEKGLRGHADGFGKDKDQWVYATELAAYTSACVERWAMHTRGLRQTPYLVSAPDEDFAIARYTPEERDRPRAGEKKGDEETAKAEAEKKAEADKKGEVEKGKAAEEKGTIADSKGKYPGWLKQRWQERDGWLADEKFRDHPQLFQRAEAALLRAERRWRGGFESERERPKLTGTLDAIGAAAKAPPAWGAEGHSLALVLPALGELKPVPPPKGEKAGPAPDGPEALKAIEEDLAKYVARLPTPSVKPDEKAKVEQALLDRLRLFAYPRAVAVLFAVAAGSDNLTPERIEFLYGMQRTLEQEQRGRPPQYLESVYLHRLKDLPAHVKAWALPAWPAGRVRQSLSTLEAARRVLGRLAGEPEATPWVADLVKQGDAQRREAERLLFTSTQADGWREVEDKLKLADRRYRAAAGRVALVARARRQLDIAQALLPGWAEMLTEQDPSEGRELATWRDAVDAAVRLRGLLAKPEPALLDAGDPEPLTRLEADLASLDGLLRERLRTTLKPGPRPDPSQWQAARVVLTGPLPAAAEREATWQTGWQVATRLDQDLSDPAPAPAVRAPRKPDGGPDARRERRARVAVELLRLVSPRPHDALAQELKAAAGKPDPDAWRGVARGLKEAWAEHLVRDADDPAGLAAQAELTAKARAAARAELAQLLAELTQAEADGLKGSHRGFFEKAASDYRRSAKALRQ